MPGDERAVSGGKGKSDRENIALRPKRLADVTGQDRVRENLSIIIDAAAGRGEPIDHLLFYGPPGLGKTSLAYVVSNEVGANIRITAGPAIERAGDLAAILTHLKKGDILFIDEVHRLGKAVEEILYRRWKTLYSTLSLARDLPPRLCALICPGSQLSAQPRAWRSWPRLCATASARAFVLTSMNNPAMEQIVKRAAGLLEVDISREGTVEIAKRARGTPRVGLRLLRRVRDFAEARADGRIDEDVTQRALELMEIDHLGLDDIDRRILQTIIEKFSGGPVGLETIAAAISEDSATIMDVYEPYLYSWDLSTVRPVVALVRRAPTSTWTSNYPTTPGPTSNAFYESQRIRLRSTSRIYRADACKSSRFVKTAPPRQGYGPHRSRSFHDIVRLLNPNDVLVMNNTRVIPARLAARKAITGGKVEILLLRRLTATHWKALIRGRNIREGLRFELDNGSVSCKCIRAMQRGQHVLEFDRAIDERLHGMGDIPLPPYIQTALDESEKYQTVYSAVDGSAAAPTAGLHFTPELMANLRNLGIKLAYCTLHIGLDTFQPVAVDDVSDHVIHSEFASLGAEAAGTINSAIASGHRIIAVGTTSARTLESAARARDREEFIGQDHNSIDCGKSLVAPISGDTDLFIVPGYDWRVR